MLRIVQSAILAAALVLSAAAWGQPNNNMHGAPRFTLAEESIIARNDALAEMLAIDPAGVRKIVAAILVAKQQTAKQSVPTRDRRRDAGAVHIDPLRNPDLDVLQRASPEAAHDLFQLIKRAAGGQTGPK